LNSIRPDLDGAEIMEILQLKQSPQVGKAYKFLLELRLDEGPKTKAEAKAALLDWWSAQK
jgi:poly(A) polymerase